MRGGPGGGGGEEEGEGGGEAEGGGARRGVYVEVEEESEVPRPFICTRNSVLMRFADSDSLPSNRQ